MPTKRELEDLIIRVDERTKSLPTIEVHLRTLNGTILVHATKIALAAAIAQEAKECADDNKKNFNKLTIGVLIALLSILGSIIGLIVAL